MSSSSCGQACGRQHLTVRAAVSGLVFTSEIGTPLEPRNVLRPFDALADRAGLRGTRLHTLRHSAASFLLATGTHTTVVQEHLGHSSSAITADIHSHVAAQVSGLTEPWRTVANQPERGDMVERAAVRPVDPRN